MGVWPLPIDIALSAIVGAGVAATGSSGAVPFLDAARVDQSIFVHVPQPFELKPLSLCEISTMDGPSESSLAIISSKVPPNPRRRA